MHPRDKSRLYHDLGELLKSGMTLPKAVARLALHSRGASRRVLEGIAAGVGRGETLADSLRGLRGIDDLDIALFSASERAGKLDRGFDLASDYYHALSEARDRIIRKSAYPLFVAHFAVVVFGITRLMGESGSVERVLQGMVMGFMILWGVIIGGLFLIKAIRNRAAQSVALDRSLGLIPVIGGMRRDLALSRFSAAYDMQLEAGVNVLGALEASGRASASAAYRSASQKAAADVRSGEPVSTALTATRAFPERFLRAFMVGEESGRLDQELRSLSEEYRIGGLRKLESLSEWVPRFIFITVAVMVAWKVVSFYFGYLKSVQDLLK